MTGSETDGETGDAATLSRRAAEQLTKLYEREVYRVYNLALRVACEHDVAAAATERAFAEQARNAGEISASGEGSPPPTLYPATVRAAISAGSRRPKVKSQDPESLALLGAAATLRPPERAALGLSTVGEDAGRISAALEIPPEQAAQLLERAMAGLAESLEAAPGTLDARLANWPWADPPAELWEPTYRAARAELDSWAKETIAADPAVAETGKIHGLGRKRATRAAKAQRKRKPATTAVARSKRRTMLLRGAGLVVVIAGVAAFYLLSDSSDPASEGTANATVYPGSPASPVEDVGVSDDSDSGDSSKGGEKPYDPLTPEELDKLRLQELDDLEQYARRQAEQGPSAADRAAAEAQLAALQKEAAERGQSGSSGGGSASGGGSSGSGGGGGKDDGGSGGGKPAVKPPASLPEDDSNSEPNPAGGSGGGGGGGTGGSSGGGGGHNGGGKGDGSDGGGGGGGGSTGPSLDDCIRDTTTGQYVCPEQDPNSAPADE